MKVMKIFCFLVSFVFCLTAAKAAMNGNYTTQHAYVLSSSSSKSKGHMLEFFHNGDAAKIFPAYSIVDGDLSHTRPKVVHQEPSPGTFHGVVVRPLYTSAYFISVDKAGYPHWVQKPGFWAMNLDTYQMVRIADAMYKFSIEGDYSNCTVRNNRYYHVDIVAFNKDDYSFASKASEWDVVPGTNVHLFNYDYGAFWYSTHDIKLVVYFYNNSSRANEYDSARYTIDGSSVGPGEYTLKCNASTHKFEIDKRTQYQW